MPGGCSLPRRQRLAWTSTRHSDETIPRREGKNSETCIRLVLVVLVVGLSLGPLSAFGQEVKEKPVLEHILDLMLQRGQIDSEQYRTLQEKARKEQAAAFQAGIENGRPFFKSADGNFHAELAGQIQADFDTAEADTKTPHGRQTWEPIPGPAGPPRGGGALFPLDQLRHRGGFQPIRRACGTATST